MNRSSLCLCVNHSSPPLSQCCTKFNNLFPPQSILPPNMVRTRGSQNQVSPPLHPLETKKQHSKRKHASNCNSDPPPPALKKNGGQPTSRENRRRPIACQPTN